MPRLLIKVVDYETRMPLMGVGVSVDGRVGVTDFRGEAVFELPAGTYTVSVRHTFYRPFEETVTVDRDRAITVRLIRATPW